MSSIVDYIMLVLGIWFVGIVCVVMLFVIERRWEPSIIIAHWFSRRRQARRDRKSAGKDGR